MKVCLVYNYAQHYRTNIFTLLDRNMDIEFYFGDKMEDVKKMDYTSLRHRVTEVKNRKFGPFEWQSGVLCLLLKKYDTYILLGGPLVLSTWLVTIFGRLMGKKIYFWSHGWYGKESRCQKIIKRLFFGLSNGIFLYGNYARNLMIEEGLNPNKLMVIHNSLMYDQQIIIRRNLAESPFYHLHFENDLANIVFIGRLTPVKKLEMLLYALAINKRKGCTYNVTFVGDGSEKVRLQQLTQKLELERSVWFYGPCYDEWELSESLYNADLCVAPGNIGLTAMHAMTYGCPCISHNNFKWQMPEFEAIREGITGSFFEYDNVESLACSIRNWLTVHRNDRAKIRQACFKEIDEYWNPHVQLDIIKNTIENGLDSAFEC